MIRLFAIYLLKVSIEICHPCKVFVNLLFDTASCTLFSYGRNIVATNVNNYYDTVVH